MEKYIGKSVYKGTAIGPINVLKKSDGIVKRQHVEDVAAELQRLEDAKKQAQAPARFMRRRFRRLAR